MKGIAMNTITTPTQDTSGIDLAQLAAEVDSSSADNLVSVYNSLRVEQTANKTTGDLSYKVYGVVADCPGSTDTVKTATPVGRLQYLAHIARCLPDSVESLNLLRAALAIDLAMTTECEVENSHTKDRKLTTHKNSSRAAFGFAEIK